TKPAQVFGILGLTYFILCFGLSRFAYWLERRLARRGLPVVALTEGRAAARKASA
ncbi:MAG: amino acid ABC transporter permease, partial [Hydrogenophaga sp.]